MGFAGSFGFGVVVVRVLWVSLCGCSVGVAQGFPVGFGFGGWFSVGWWLTFGWWFGELVLVDLLLRRWGGGACGFGVCLGGIFWCWFVVLCNVISCVLVGRWLVWDLVVLLCGLGGRFIGVLVVCGGWLCVIWMACW